MAGLIDGEDVAEAGVVVEWVAVYIVRRFLGGEKEDGAGFGVGVVCAGWWGGC